jgi:hypothetical protein
MRKFKWNKAAAQRVRAHPTATRKTGAVLLRKSRLTTFGLHGWLVIRAAGPRFVPVLRLQSDFAVETYGAAPKRPLLALQRYLCSTL